MQPRTGGAAGVVVGADAAWSLVLAAAGASGTITAAARPATFSVGDDLRLAPVRSDDPSALLAWHPGRGWTLLLPPDHPQHAFIDLYLPICGATSTNPITVGHLGQSLDGFIATRAGDSQFVTGPENIVHLHRLRALSDANPEAVICHPGPMNRGLEISADAADAAQSLVLDQVSAGVAVRMSVLYHLLAGEGAVA